MIRFAEFKLTDCGRRSVFVNPDFITDFGEQRVAINEQPSCYISISGEHYIVEGTPAEVAAKLTAAAADGAPTPTPSNDVPQAHGKDANQ